MRSRAWATARDQALRFAPATVALALLSASAYAAQETALRVCADPNNLPFSNEARAGFENKLADMVAQDFGEPVTYTWWAQRRGFVRNTLKAKDCDVVMGVPEKLDMVLTTRPYYRSTYVFVSRADRHIDTRSIKDPALRKLTIGVQLIGDDGANTPPADALGQEGIIRNLVGYLIYGDYRNPNPPQEIVKAVAEGKVDIAAVWGPLAGYVAKHSPTPLRVVPIEDTQSFAPLTFEFDISMGVRKGDDALKARLDDFIARKQPEIRSLLTSYGVPLVAVPTSQARSTVVK